MTDSLLPIAHLEQVVAAADLTTHSGCAEADERIDRAISAVGGILPVLLDAPDAIPWWSLPGCLERLRRALDTLPAFSQKHRESDERTELVQRLHASILLILRARMPAGEPRHVWPDAWLETMLRVLASAPYGTIRLPILQTLQEQSPALLPFGAEALDAMKHSYFGCLTCNADYVGHFLTLGALPGHPDAKNLIAFVDEVACARAKQETKDAMDRRLLDQLADNIERHPKAYSLADLRALLSAAERVPRRHLTEATRLKRAAIQALNARGEFA
jgi:hypothetical protein